MNHFVDPGFELIVWNVHGHITCFTIQLKTLGRYAGRRNGIVVEKHAVLESEKPCNQRGIGFEVVQKALYRVESSEICKKTCK